MQTLKVLSVNVSEKKGTVKKPVDSIELCEVGVRNDAHSGSWHRQVSLLGKESFAKFSLEAKRELQYGEFAENITTEGVLLYKTSPLDVFKNKDIELMVTQIGKKCHGDGCAIYREVGNCVMPKEGIFAKVIKGGEMKAGMELEYHPKIYKVKVITLSDRASNGEYEDLSGPEIGKLLNDYFEKANKQLSVDYTIIPDDSEALESLMLHCKDKYDAVITTGGTGIGPRDITPDVIRPLLDKEIPGIMEIIRVRYGMEKPNASLSRSIAGIMGRSLVYTLPGSVKAVREYMDEILKTLEHLIYMQYGLDVH
ncbi:MAG: molybdenum cofactor synthesis domain-containing protein [Bacteroidota bacterium]